MSVASELLSDTFLKGDSGKKVKQDFNRRLGVLLLRWNFRANPEESIEKGLDFMLRFNKRDFRSNQEFAESMDEYFNAQGVKGAKAAMKILDFGRNTE